MAIDRSALNNIIDGKKTADQLDLAIAEKTLALKAAHNITPTLAVVLVGDDPASHVYVKNKVRRTNACHMESVEHRVSANIDQKTLEALVAGLSDDPNVDGILVQLPLPKHLNTDAVIGLIAPEKDVDGLTEISAGKLVLGRPGLRPCTPEGCVILAQQALGDLSGKHVVVIGRSILVGKPAALLFLEQNCTVTIAHSRTKDLPAVCAAADILVAAVGRPLMVKKEWVKAGACVIDVGINRVPAPDLVATKGPEASRLVGDVDFEDVGPIAGHITPVPGGVGPMTIAGLLQNTLKACVLRRGLNFDPTIKI